MRSIHPAGLLVVAALLGATACAGPQAPPTEDHTADLTALDSLRGAFITAYDAGDAAALTSLWAEDGTLAPPLMPTLDRAQIQSMYAEQFAQGLTGKLQVNQEGAMISGDRASAWGGFIVTGQLPDGSEFTAHGRYGSVSMKQADGSWKLFRHMYNWEAPPPGFGAPAE